MNRQHCWLVFGEFLFYHLQGLQHGISMKAKMLKLQTRTHVPCHLPWRIVIKDEIVILRSSTFKKLKMSCFMQKGFQKMALLTGLLSNTVAHICCYLNKEVLHHNPRFWRSLAKTHRPGTYYYCVNGNNSSQWHQGNSPISSMLYAIWYLNKGQKYSTIMLDSNFLAIINLIRP